MKILTRLVAIGIVIISILSVSIYFAGTKLPDPKENAIENAIECAKQIIWDNIENTSSITFPWRKNKWDISQTGDTFHAIVDFDTKTFYDAPAKKTASVYFTVTGTDENGNWKYLVDEVSILDMEKLQGARPTEKVVQSTEKAKTSESLNVSNSNTGFEAAQKIIEQNIKRWFPEQSFFSLWSVTATAKKDVLVVNFTMDEKMFFMMVELSNRNDIKKEWKQSITKTLQKQTESWSEIFHDYGSDPVIMANILNPVNTDKAILTVINGIVQYDEMDE